MHITCPHKGWEQQTGTSGKRLTHAHHFADLVTSGSALKKIVQKANMTITLKLIFSSDKMQAYKKFIELTDPPEIFYPDVVKTQKLYAPDYTFTDPVKAYHQQA